MERGSISEETKEKKRRRCENGGRESGQWLEKDRNDDDGETKTVSASCLFEAKGGLIDDEDKIGQAKNKKGTSEAGYLGRRANVSGVLAYRGVFRALLGGL